MIAALFVLKLAAGITLMWWLMPRKEVTDGFFRIQMRVLLGLGVLAALLFTTDKANTTAADRSDTNRSVAGSTSLDAEASTEVAEQTGMSGETKHRIRNMSIAICLISYAGSVFWALGRRLPGNICIYLLLILCCGALAMHSMEVANKSSLFEQLLSDFASAAVLGGVLTGMLLGHWYLTTPTMSINPLLWFNVAIILAVAVRTIASTWAVLKFGAVDDLTQQMWLGMRWLGGIACPAVTVLLVWRIMKHRNTQSATGVLFAGLILVFMGEMTATLLEQATLIPY